MLLGGLWHGAAWHFVVWGGLNGIALAVHRARGGVDPRGRPEGPHLRDVPAVLANFALVSALWVFFRADSIGVAGDLFAGLTRGFTGADDSAWKANLLLVGLATMVMLAMDLIDRRRIALQPLATWPAWLQGAMAGGAVVAILIWSGTIPQPFIYFQF